jgi:serine/threonine-protein kinase
MPLTQGARLGPYEVVGALGAGGMGEVYRARDARLGRDVALKILPGAFASDADRMARFQREAQVLASLNHPNIGAIHGLEEADGVRALVLELVEGPTLADRLASGSGLQTPGHAGSPKPGAGGLPLDEVLPIARQIVDALEAAHERGIVHRDLKPANIKIRPDGTVKVLDFGLAKAIGSVAQDFSPAAGGCKDPHDITSPTLTTPAMTGIGMIMGTAAYMSPEQAKGRPVDKRSDVWAFGCVLYEMLTGRRAFQGDDVADTLATVLKSDPDWSLLPADTPPSIRRLLRKCLVKDPKSRVPDISVARFEIGEVLSGAPQEAPAAAPVVRRPPRGRTLAAMAGVAVAAAAAAVLGTWTFLRPSPEPVTRLTMQRPDSTPMGSASVNHDVAITPDGRRIAYVVGDGAVGQELAVRSLDQLEPLKFSGIGNPVAPFTSPDGKWVGYFDNITSSLRKVPIVGGSALTIGPYSGQGRGASWGDDDKIVFATLEPTAGLMRVAAGGGTPEMLTKPDPAKGEVDHWFPDVLPGARGVLFTLVPIASTIAAGGQIALLDLQTGQWRVLIPGGSFARYAPSGHIVYGAGGTLRAVGFDLERLQLVGDPVPVLEHVMTKGSGAANFDLAQNGTLAYLSGDAMGGSLRSLAWIDRDGREEPITAPTRAYAYPRLSPDGTKVALDIRDQENDVWIWDLVRRTLTRLTFDPGVNRGVAWTPDGKRLAFSAQRDGTENVYWQASDGTGTAERLTEGKRPQLPNAFTPDGTQLLFQEPGAAPYDAYKMNVTGDRKIEPLLANPGYSERNAEVSPDGRWVAYQTNESGQEEIYVRPFPNIDAGRWQVSNGGGSRPAWARNGKELFYFLQPGRIMAVPIQTGTTFSAGNPVEVVKGQFIAPQDGRTYDVSPDGKRFLVIKDATRTASTPPQLVVVLNWLDELKRLVP